MNGRSPTSRARRRAVLAIAVYGWINGTLAGGVARLDDRFDLTASAVASHVVVFAIGLTLAGLRRFDRGRRWAPLALSTAAIPFLAATHVGMSLAAVFVLGVVGSPTLATAQAQIGSSGPRSSRTLVIANLNAAVTAAAAAAIVAALPLDLIVVAAFPPCVVSLWIVLGDVSLPGALPSRKQPRRPDRAETSGLVLVGVAVGIEASLGNQLVGYLEATGSAAISGAGPPLLFCGIAGGRAIGALRPVSAERTLPAIGRLLGALTVALITLQLSSDIVVRAGSIALVGAALGPIYPLAVAYSLHRARVQVETSALTTVATGFALVTAPMVVGAASDALAPSVGFVVLTSLAVCAGALSMSHID